MNELGKLALADGERASAKQYFQQAAAAGGPLGQEASAAFIALDVQDNPGAYVQAQAWIDQFGRVLVRLGSRSPVQLDGIEVEVAALINGSVRRTRIGLRSLAAGGVQDLDSGLAFPRGSQWTQDLVSAQLVGIGR